MEKTYSRGGGRGDWIKTEEMKHLKMSQHATDLLFASTGVTFQLSKQMKPLGSTEWTNSEEGACRVC